MGRPGSRNVASQAWPCYFYTLITHELSKMTNPGSFDGFSFFSHYFGNVLLLVGEMEKEDLGFRFCCGKTCI